MNETKTFHPHNGCCDFGPDPRGKPNSSVAHTLHKGGDKKYIYLFMGSICLCSFQRILLIEVEGDNSHIRMPLQCIRCLPKIR